MGRHKTSEARRAASRHHRRDNQAAMEEQATGAVGVTERWVHVASLSTCVPRCWTHKWRGFICTQRDTMCARTRTRAQDAWVVRHCCLAIKALAPHIRAASAAGELAPASLKLTSGGGAGKRPECVPGGSPGIERGAGGSGACSSSSLVEGACRLLVQVLVTPHLGRNWWVWMRVCGAHG